jgi:TorA maturation chaperone TorD
LETLENQRPDTLDVIIEAIHSFLGEHLLQWAPTCLRLVIDHAANDYYRGCAHLALGCLFIGTKFCG